ncbi:hypothetical protein SKAU_G00256690 [Synaphobranchus kaupii]|uniref:Uncharacterized protein n=1 Tax=Synaphobranchus kaupii TaxID=118154 RepID=A0A9Q1IQB0_SYNKA|nr:hypothetical protein SKAU_G00256690 [Synaphobranchus kaupii]
MTLVSIAAKDTRHSRSNETITTLPPNGPNEDRSAPLGWLYISITAGVLVLTVIAVVTFCKLRSKGKRTQDRLQRDLQFSAPLKKEEPPQTSLPASPRPRLPDCPRSVRSPHAPRPPSVRSSCVYDNAPAPAGRSSRTKRAPAREAPPPPPSGNRGSARPVPAGRDGVYDNEREEAENLIVYAALDHQVVRKAPSLGNTYVPMEELTEYAAIRVS